MNVKAEIFRNGSESRYFTLNDTIEIRLKCSKKRSIGIFIYDSKNRVRYRGFGSGEYLEFKTKFKYTDVYGVWKLVVIDTKTKQQKEIPIKFLTLEEMRLREYIEKARIRQGKPITEISQEPLTRAVKSGWGLLLGKHRIHIIGHPFLIPGFISSNPLILAEKVVVEEKRAIEEEEKIDLGIPVIELKGIGKTYETRLNRAGIFTTSQLLNYSAEKLAEITNARISRCKEWISQARQIQEDVKHPLRSKAKPVLSDKEPRLISVERVKGIGPTYARRLRSAGISTVNDLLKTSPEKLKEISKAPISRINQWIEFSKQLIEEQGVSDVQSKKLSVEEELVQIKGIGPVTAKKLISAGVKNIRDLVLMDIDELKPFIRGSPEKISVILGNAFYALLVKDRGEATSALKMLQKKDKTKEFEDLLSRINEVDESEASNIVSEYKLNKFLGKKENK